MIKQLSKRLKLWLFKKLHDPLFFLGTALLFFWLVDTWYKVFIQHAPTRIFWWSSAGLGLTSIGLILGDVFLITSMLCALFVTEGVWTLSFFSNLFLNSDNFLFAKYAFGKTFPFLGFVITLFHLFIIPSLLFAIIRLRSISKNGWVGAYVFALVVAYIPYFFPNKEDVNCVRGSIDACRLYFQFLYNLSPEFRIFIAATILLFLCFLPTNILLALFNKSLKIKFSSTNRIKNKV